MCWGECFTQERSVMAYATRQPQIRKGGAECGSFLYPRRWLTHIPQEYKEHTLNVR